MRTVTMCLLCVSVGCASVRPTSSPIPTDLSGVHPIENPKAEFTRAAHAVPQGNKDRTHLFFINGLDPYFLANFCGQCEYMKSLGYQNAYCGQLSDADLFRQMIVKVRENDPEARLVLVGYSVGANSAQLLAQQLDEDGIPVDLLVYVAGDFITNTSRPANVKRMLSVSGHVSILLGYNLFLQAPEIEGAVNHRLDTRHFLLPTRAETMELLIKHVAELERR